MFSVRRIFTTNSEGGFTLLEVIMSVTILVTLSVATTQMIKSSINMREAISERAKIDHRLNLVMQKVTQDLQHAFIISTVRNEYNPGGRATKTTFKTKRESGDNTELSITTMTHRSYLANSSESDQSYVVYKIESDEDNRDLFHLKRGETKWLPKSLNDEVPMQVLARNIKSFKVYPWNGDSWARDGWDTDRSEWRNMLPQMVMVEIEAYEEDPQEEGVSQDTGKDKATVKMNTIVYLPRSFGMKEPKSRQKSVRWLK